MTGSIRITITALTMLTAIAAEANLIRAEINPRRLTVGDVGEILLVSTNEPPRIEKLPSLPWLSWLDGGVPMNRREIRVVNNDQDRRFSARYRFRAVKEGEFTFPALVAREGNVSRKLDLGAVTVESRRILRNGKRVGLDELVFICLGGEDNQLPKRAWVGEAIPLTVDVCIDSQLRVHDNTLNDQNNYFPSVDLENVSYRDFSDQNRYNSKMLYSPRVQERINGRLTAVYRFRLVMLPVEPGEITGAVRHQIPLVFSSRRGPNLDPFQVLMQTARVVPHDVRAKLPTIKVEPLPTPPTDAGEFVGLIGDWKLDVKLARDQVTAGEDVELVLTATGTGSLESFRPPDLDFPGVQVYEPEIQQTVDPETKLTVKWLLVPRQAGSALPPLKLATFVAKDGVYSTQTFNPKLEVLPSDTPLPAAPQLATGNGDVPLVHREDHQRQQDILNVRSEAPTYLSLPLWQNSAPSVLALLLLGPLLFGVSIVLANRREHLAANTGLRRQRHARRDRARILKLLEQENNDAYEVVRADVVPWLIEYLDLPRGTTVSELRQQVGDDELAEILETAQQGAFMPGAATRLSGTEISARLRRFSNLLVLGLAVAAATWPIAARATDASPMQSAAESYYAQEFQAAADHYRQLARNGHDSWQLRYNLANCLFRQCKYAAAVANYERALRLAPRESDILQNLNFTRSQLGLPVARTNDSPTAILATARDHLRPDEWLMVAALGWFAAFAALSIFRLRRKAIRPWILIPVAVALVGCLAAFVQTRSTYRHGQAIVVALETATRPFPDSEKTTGSPLSAGREIRVLEKRSEWTRVRVDEAEGWIPNTDYQLVW